METNQTELCELDRRIAQEKTSAFSMRSELKNVSRELGEIGKRLSPHELEKLDLSDPEISGSLPEAISNDLARREGLRQFQAMIQNRILAADSVVEKLLRDRENIVLSVESKLRFCKDIRDRLNTSIPAERQKLADALELFDRQTAHTEKELQRVESEIPKLCPGDVVQQIRLKLDMPHEGAGR